MVIDSDGGAIAKRKNSKSKVDSKELPASVEVKLLKGKGRALTDWVFMAERRDIAAADRGASRQTVPFHPEMARQNIAGRR